MPPRVFVIFHFRYPGTREPKRPWRRGRKNGKFCSLLLFSRIRGTTELAFESRGDDVAKAGATLDRFNFGALE